MKPLPSTASICCDEMSTTVGDIQSPETILPTRKIGSLKRLDAAKITEHGLHKRKKQKKQKCTTSAIALYEGYDRDTAMQNDKSWGLRYSIIFARHT